MSSHGNSNPHGNHGHVWVFGTCSLSCDWTCSRCGLFVTGGPHDGGCYPGRGYAIPECLGSAEAREKDGRRPKYVGVDNEGLMLKSVDYHNQQRRRERKEREEAALKTGVACPKCSKELKWLQCGYIGTVFPPATTAQARCSDCGITVDLEK